MLSPYRVIDLTTGPAALGPMILADLGADVIKVEQPGGSPERRAAPFAPGPKGPESFAFHIFNRNKRGVAIDFATVTGRTDFLELVRGADFLFEDAAPGVMTALGLGFAELSAVNPSLVYVATTPFGQDGPYSGHRANDLTIAAMGGMMALLGEPDRRPVRISVPQTWFHGAAESAFAALVAHQRRLATGEAQFVDVSVQASVF